MGTPIYDRYGKDTEAARLATSAFSRKMGNMSLPYTMASPFRAGLLQRDRLHKRHSLFLLRRYLPNTRDSLPDRRGATNVLHRLRGIGQPDLSK